MTEPPRYNDPVAFGDVRDVGVRPDTGIDRTPPPPGRHAAVLGALGIGLVLLALQLWLLTVALELYLGGKGSDLWVVALISGLIFLGGLLMLRHLSKRLITMRRTG